MALERTIKNADYAFNCLREDYATLLVELNEQRERCAKLEARVAELEARQ
jgi:hypothetical protein